MNRVEGKENLYKTSTGGVINADQNAYRLAKAHKKRLLQEQQEKEELKDRIDRLERAIEQLTDVKL